jgi:hypothetical protein
LKGRATTVLGFSAKLFKDASLEFASLFNELQIEIAVLNMRRKAFAQAQADLAVTYFYVGINIYRRFCEF